MNVGGQLQVRLCAVATCHVPVLRIASPHRRQTKRKARDGFLSRARATITRPALEGYSEPKTQLHQRRLQATGRGIPQPLPPSSVLPAQQNTSVTMLVSLTVGKVDAGVTVLLTPDKRLVSSRAVDF